jgi:hypothetical protein
LALIVIVAAVIGGIAVIQAPFSQYAPPDATSGPAVPMRSDAAVPPTRAQQEGDSSGPLAPGDLDAHGGLPEISSVTEADGLLPDGATVFDGEYPGIANLDANLLDALQRAATDSGLDFPVSSGWRSAQYQERLLDQAVAIHGSEAEAARWVAPADKSLHVSGDAVDLDGPKSKAWLAEHGSAYGLCLVYENEPWHFEFRSDAPTRGCPAPYEDSAHDPRLQ